MPKHYIPSGIIAVGSKMNGAVFMLFDITNAEISLATVFHKPPLATLFWGVGGFENAKVRNGRIGYNPDLQFNRLFRVGFNINIAVGAECSSHKAIVASNFTFVYNHILCKRSAQSKTKQEYKQILLHGKNFRQKYKKIMDPLSEIKKSIKGMLSKNGSFACFTAKVKSVNGETCEVELDGMKLTDVRLRAVVNGENSKILVTPKTDSYVLVADMSGDLSQLAVIGFSEVDKIEIDATDKIIFNGGNNKGLVKVEPMVKWMQKVYNDLQTLIGLLRNSSVAGNNAPLAITFTPTTPSPAIDDFQNKDITH